MNTNLKVLYLAVAILSISTPHVDAFNFFENLFKSGNSNKGNGLLDGVGGLLQAGKQGVNDVKSAIMKGVEMKNEVHGNIKQMLGRVGNDKSEDPIVLEDVVEVCDNGVMNLSCNKKEKLNIMQAIYGRKETGGKCMANENKDIGCYSDVHTIIQSLCSGKHNCTVRVAPIFRLQVAVLYDSNACPKDSKSYLEVTYQCLREVIKKKAGNPLGFLLQAGESITSFMKQGGQQMADYDYEASNSYYSEEGNEYNAAKKDENGECKGGRIFTDCGIGCEKTCENPNPVCEDGCFEKCECPFGTVLDVEGQCILARACASRRNQPQTRPEQAVLGKVGSFFENIMAKFMGNIKGKK